MQCDLRRIEAFAAVVRGPVLAVRAGMLRSAAVALALVTAAAPIAGCRGLTPNHARGLTAVGAAATITGALKLVDGATCDEAHWNGADCTYDAAELRTGAIVTTAGAALLAWSLWRLFGDEPERTAPATSRTAARPGQPSRVAPRD